jgi:hypothetical protein
MKANPLGVVRDGLAPPANEPSHNEGIEMRKPILALAAVAVAASTVAVATPAQACCDYRYVFRAKGRTDWGAVSVTTPRGLFGGGRQTLPFRQGVSLSLSEASMSRISVSQTGGWASCSITRNGVVIERQRTTRYTRSATCSAS